MSDWCIKTLIKLECSGFKNLPPCPLGSSTSSQEIINIKQFYRHWLFQEADHSHSAGTRGTKRSCVSPCVAVISAPEYWLTAHILLANQNIWCHRILQQMGSVAEVVLSVIVIFHVKHQPGIWHEEIPQHQVLTSDTMLSTLGFTRITVSRVSLRWWRVLWPRN